MNLLQLIGFFILCTAIVYFGNCIFAKKFIRIEPKMAMLYVSTLALLGIFGEIFVNSVYHFFFGTALWEYHIYPIHHGYSSQFAVFLWGIYGLHLYLLHGALAGRKITSKKYMTYVFAFEGVAIEFITNALFLLSFGEYLFYYPPSDLWHLTSVQVLPAYLAGGFIIVKTLKRFKKDPWFFIIMNLLLTGVVVFLA